VEPATRVPSLLLHILIDAASEPPEADDPATATALAPICSYLPPGMPTGLVQRAIMVWTGLFGAISFELYGHLYRVVAEDSGDRDAFFDACIRRWIEFTGISPLAPAEEPLRDTFPGGSGRTAPA
jgi:hypothetical protein